MARTKQTVRVFILNCLLSGISGRAVLWSHRRLHWVKHACRVVVHEVRPSCSADELLPAVRWQAHKTVGNQKVPAGSRRKGKPMSLSQQRAMSSQTPTRRRKPGVVALK